MAYEILGFSYTLEASTDLSDKQFYGIVVDTNGQAAIAGAGVKIDGVLQNDPEVQGYAATIVQTGISKCKVGTGGIEAGDEVEVEADGEFITLASGESVGKALQTGAIGVIISVLLY